MFQFLLKRIRLLIVICISIFEKIVCYELLRNLFHMEIKSSILL